MRNFSELFTLQSAPLKKSRRLVQREIKFVRRVIKFFSLVFKLFDLFVELISARIKYQ